MVLGLDVKVRVSFTTTFGFTHPVLAAWFIRQLLLIFRRIRKPILLFPPNWARFIL